MFNRYSEAESVLTGETAFKTKESSYDELITEFGDKSCFVFKLLATIAMKTNRNEQAAEFYQRSLKLNPFLWNSFEQLCDMGQKVEPNEIFTVAKLDNFSSCHGVNPVVNFVNNMPEQQTQPLHHNTDHYKKLNIAW